MAAPRVENPPSAEEIRRRAKLLVIDDNAFAYEDLFRRDGYDIERWPDIRSLARLTDDTYSLILLDLHGVGLKEDPDNAGLGILRHIKETNPAQLVVAYSAVDWSPRFHEFFSQADAVLEKDAAYVSFRSEVDSLLRRRSTPGYFVSKMNNALGEFAVDAPRAVSIAKRCFRKRSTMPMERYLSKKITDSVTADRVLAVIGIAVSVL